MKLKIASLFMILAVSSNAANISISSVGQNYDGSDDFGIVLSNGTPVAPNAGLVSVGYFSTFSDVQVTNLANANDYSTLFALGSFITIFSDDFTGIADAYGPTDGFVQGSITGFNATGLNNTLYAYITSGTEFGLFRSNLTIVPDPAPPTPPSNYQIYFDAGTAVIGSFGPSYQVDYSNIGGGTVFVNSFQLVPEPSTALLGAFGVLALLRRRRN